MVLCQCEDFTLPLDALLNGSHSGREVLELNPNVNGVLYPVCDYLRLDIQKDCLFSDTKLDAYEVRLLKRVAIHSIGV